MKTLKIGPISFTEKGYEKFTALTKDEQIEKVYNSLSPKDRKRAEQLLKDIPHGTGINGGNEQEAQEDKREHASGGNGGDNPDNTKAAEGSKRKRTHPGA